MRDIRPRLNRAAFTRCSIDWSWDSGPLPDHDLWVVEAGRGTMSTPEGELPILPGHAYRLRRGERYHGRQDPARPLTVGAVHFAYRDDRGRLAAPADPTPPVMVRLRDPDLALGLLRRLLDATPERADTWFAALHEEVEASAAAQDASPADRAVDAVCAAIRADPAARWRVVDLAARCGWSRHHFARRFRARTDRSPRDFVVATRLRAAQDLLAGSNLSVTRIAEELGYADVYHFSRQFRVRTGSTPTAWRAAARSVPGLHRAAGAV